MAGCTGWSIPPFTASSGRGTPSRVHRAREQFDDGAQEDKESRRRRELGEFLKAKRAALRPEDLGLSASGRRRSPGLRREELAQVSRSKLHGTSLQAVLDGYASGPAFAIDPWGNVLAFNKIADFVYHFKDYDGPWRNNHIWRFFMDPYRRQLHPDWLDLARYLVGLARGFYAAKSKDTPEYRRMLADLCKASPDFNQMWNESRRQRTSPLAPGIPFHYRVPGFGHLTFHSVRLTVPSREEMAIFMSPLDDTTREVMLLLTSRQGKSRP
jgi:hypothetical protein